MKKRPLRSEYLIVYVLLLGTFLSFYKIGSKSFWLDEVYSVLFVSSSWADLLQIIAFREANMSLYYLILKPWVLVFGSGETAVRSLSALFGLGGILMTYIIGRRLFDQQTALIAATLLSVNVFFIQYAQEARVYTLLLLLATISIYLFIIAIERNSWNSYLAWGAFNGMLLYAHFFGTFLIIAQLTSLLFKPLSSGQCKKLLSSILLTGVLASPLLIYMLGFLLGSETYDIFGWIPNVSFWSIVSLFQQFAGGRILLLIYFVASLLVTLALIQKMILQKQNIPWEYSLVYLWMGLPIALLFILSIYKPFFIHRYVMFCLPALVLLAANGLTFFKKYKWPAIGTFVIIFFSLQALFLNHYSYQRDDWKSAVHYVTQHAQAGDGILFYSPVAQIPFEFYYTNTYHNTSTLNSVYPYPMGISIKEKIFSGMVENPNQSMIKNISEHHNRLWVILRHDMSEGMGWDSRAVIKDVEKKYIYELQTSFGRILINLFISKEQ